MKQLQFYFLSMILCLVALDAQAQTIKQFNGQLSITAMEDKGDYNYNITGSFTDASNTFSASQAMVGDHIMDKDGNVFVILSLTVGGAEIVSQTKALDKKEPAFGAGIIFRSSAKGFPLITLDAPAAVMTNALNTATLSIDAKIPNYQSGTTLPPITWKVGSVIFNTTDLTIYKLTSNGWAQISKSDVPIEYAYPLSSAPAGDKGDVIYYFYDDQYYTYDGIAWVSPSSLSTLPAIPKFGDVFYNTGDKNLYMLSDMESTWINISSTSIPGGSTPALPTSPKVGDMFFNIDENKLYVYDNKGTWLEVSLNGSTPVGVINPDPASTSLQQGVLFYNTTEKQLYVYNGSTWMPMGNALANGQIYVGNVSNLAAAVTMSGDATLINSGKLTVKSKAISDEKLDKENIPISGFATPTDDLSMGDGTTNYKIINLANPSAPQDAVTKSYVDLLFMNPTNILTLASGNLFVGNASNRAVATNKNVIPLSGFGSATSNISLGDGITNYKIVNLASPTNLQDAATKNYVDTRIIDPASITLANSNLLVGNSSGKAAAVTKNTISLNGFGIPTADISLGDGTTNYKIINLANPIAAQDAATKNYVDSKTIDLGNLNLASESMFVGNSSGKATAILKNAIPLSGFGPASADISFGNFKLTNLATPLGDNDAATKKYIDDLFLAPGTSLALASGKLFLGNISGKAIATATSAIPISGFGKATATINMGDGATQYNISFMADPLYPQDAATKNYVDSKIAGPGSLTLTFGYILVGNASNQAVEVSKSNVPISDFGAATAGISLGNGTNNYKITNLADPTADQEAATKKYVDTKTASTKSGGTLPSTGQVADTYYSTTDNRLYVYNGTTWVTVDNALPNGQLYVGNASGIATATTKNTIPISDFGAATAEISLGNGTNNYKISNLADPTADQEAATKKYVDEKAISTQNGGTIPTSGKIGDTFYSTTDNRLYIYNGTSWVPVEHGDNLGNHTASANLKMSTFNISNDGVNGKGLGFDTSDNATFGQNVTINGNFYTPSDQRLKTNIETLSMVLQAIDQIRGVRFEYKNQTQYATGPKIGLIAQELQKVYPEMVNKGKDGFLKVDYTQLTGVLIQAIKEQQKQMRQQQQEINNLKDRMNSQQQQIDAIFKKLQ